MSRSRFIKVGGVLPLETITGSVPVIDTNHAQVHEANAFVPIIDVTLSNSEVHDILCSIPAGVYVHFQAMSIQTLSGGATVAIYKDAVYASFEDDLSVTPHNRDHVEATASMLSFMSDQSPTTDGTLVDKLAVLSAGKGTSGVGGDVAEPEMIFKPDTLVLFRLTNLETSDNEIIFKPFWYEEGEA